MIETAGKIERMIAKSLRYPHYGIKGKYIDVKLNNSCNSDIYRDVWLPAYVVAEYPKFFIVEILPHHNPTGYSYGESKPYRIGINKMSIIFKETEIREDITKKHCRPI